VQQKKTGLISYSNAKEHKFIELAALGLESMQAVLSSNVSVHKTTDF